MRLNRYLAQATGKSRREADGLIAEGKVTVDGRSAVVGQTIEGNQMVRLEGASVEVKPSQTIILNKPVGYVTSRRQQGKSPTIYGLLPPMMHHLKPVGRLDKDSSGLIILTNDGLLAQKLAHPSSGKWKTYIIELDRQLKKSDRQKMIAGIQLDDGLSQMKIEALGKSYCVQLQEGRNRQIRRTFAALGYKVEKLHRTDFGAIKLGGLTSGKWRASEGNEA